MNNAVNRGIINLIAYEIEIGDWSIRLFLFEKNPLNF